MRLTDFNTGLDFSLSQLLSGIKRKPRQTPIPPTRIRIRILDSQLWNAAGCTDPAEPETATKSVDKYGYPVFDMPWSLNVRYSLNYLPSGFRTNNITQTLSFDGNVTITPKMSATFHERL